MAIISLHKNEVTDEPGSGEVGRCRNTGGGLDTLRSIGGTKEKR